MPEIEPMTWEQAHEWDAMYGRTGNPFKEGHPAHAWLDRAMGAIALARQEKARADESQAQAKRCGDRIDKAERLSDVVEALLSGLEKAWEFEKPLVNCAFAHGVEYRGPDLSPLIQEIRDALKAYAGGTGN